MLHVFPTSECIVEGHIGIPLVHWFPSKCWGQRFWAFLLRKLGFGTGFGIGTKSDREWVRDALAWADKYVFYRSWKDIKRVFCRYFEIESYTRQQLAWHLAPKHDVLSRICRLLMRYESPVAVMSWLQWHRNGRAIVCKPRLNPICY